MSRRGNGEGSIYQRSNGRWVGEVSVGVGRRKAIYGRSRADVAKRMTTVLRAQQQGLPVANDRLTVGAYLTDWIEGARMSVRPNTARRYASLVRKYLIPSLGRMPLTRLTAHDVSIALAAMMENGSAARSAIAVRVVLGRALREAEAQGIVARNVARLARPPRAPHQEMRTLTAEQTRVLLRASEGGRFAALYQLAVGTGARQGELLALRWADVDFDTRLIRIRRTLIRSEHALAFAEPKTRSSRRAIPIGPYALESLRRHRVAQAAERLAAGVVWEDHDLVFPSELGTPLDAGNFLRRAHYPLLVRAGLPRVRFHDLRHTAATLMLEQGTNPKVVAERLGHATVNVTLNVYSHVTATMQREAAATMDRLLSGGA